MIIYKATNKTNGKAYIGQSTFDLEKRKGEHLKGSQRQKPRYFFHRAIKKYGMDDFDWEILAECETKEELDRTELWFIRKHKTIAPHGYNTVLMSGGGDTFNTHPNKEEIRKRISEGTKKGIARSKKSWSKYGKANGMYGRKHSPESIKKMEKNRKGLTAGEKNPSAKNAGIYKVFYPNGKIEIVKNIRKFCRENNLPHGPFYQICNGKQTSKYKGWWCERISISEKMTRQNNLVISTEFSR